MTTPLHKIFGEEPDTRQEHLTSFLRIIGKSDEPAWREAAEHMAAMIAVVIRERPGHKRLDARVELETIDKLALDLIERTGRDDVMNALRIFAPPNPRGPGDVTGNEFLTSLAARATRAANRISRTQGERLLAADLGQPTAERLCATMVREAMTLIGGRPPGERNETALEACSALWAAGGGSPKPGDSGSAPHGAWVRHLRDTRTKAEAATLSALVSATSCLRRLQPETT